MNVNRKPADSKEEAIQIAKDLSKLGYTYIE
jgi:isopropylmalate/homocitrate/citramalate synthase